MSQEIDKLIQETQSNKAAKTTLDIYKYINKHQSFVIREFKGYIKYFEDYFDVLNNTISNLNFIPKENWPQYKSLSYLMFPETLKTLHRAFEDTVAGYYEEAVILLRNVYETYIRMIFIICYPKDYEAIFTNRKHKRNFNLTNFVKDDLHFDWEFLYRFMSYVSHSKMHLILMRLIKLSKKEDRNPIRLEYKYDRDAISRPMNLSTFLLYVLFNFMLETFRDDFNNSRIKEEDILKMSKIDKTLRGILESLPNKFSSIVKDIDKVGKIIHAVKQRKDWNNILNNNTDSQ